MEKGQDIVTTFPGVTLVHHNLPGSRLEINSKVIQTGDQMLQQTVNISRPAC